MDSKMIISLGELTQILEATRISSSQEEHILTIVKNSSTSPKVKEESEEELEASTVEDIKDSREQSLEPEVEEAKEETVMSGLKEEAESNGSTQ